MQMTIINDNDHPGSNDKLDWDDVEIASAIDPAYIVDIKVNYKIRK